MEEVVLTKKLVSSGSRVILTIPKEISDSFGLDAGDLIEAKIRIIKKKK